ncbi:MAG: hypothetical protein K6E80_08930 [Schwartzia sp.]|nr:hypothetical protein [Schwartzia sp. (in: firmicutes)]
MSSYTNKISLLAGLMLVESICMPVYASAVNDENGEALQDMDSLNRLGQEAIKRQDYAEAENYFRRAREEAERNGSRDFIKEMDARRAAMYINSNEPSRAEIILAPYLGKGMDMYMLSDYLMALRFNNKPEEAMAVFERYVTDWSSMPVYGLQNAGDIYLRQKRYEKARDIYLHILMREKAEDVPFVQLGYAYALARLGHDKEAVSAYGKMANVSQRLNNVIAGDGDAFLSEGRVGFARRLYGLLGATESEREEYQLRYALALVNVGKDYDNDALNFRRDELLGDRNFYHEAEGILRRLEKSSNPDIAHDAEVGRYANRLHKGLLADSRRGLKKLLEADAGDAAALAVKSEYVRNPQHELSTFYRESLDDDNNRERSAGASYESYWGNNFYVSREVSRFWLRDGKTKAVYWQSASGLRRQFDWGSVYGELTRYSGTGKKYGFRAELEYEFNDLTKLSLEVGRRMHRHAAAVAEGVSENYRSVRLSHILTPRLTVEGSYEWARLSDDNKFRSYSADVEYLLQVRHNFRDKLRAEYSKEKYAEDRAYDSPWRRDDYSIGFARKWDFPKIQTSWELTTGLGWSRDNDEKTSFAPGMRLEYTKGFADNQSLVVGLTLVRYFNKEESDDERKHRKSGYVLDISYNWGW